MKPEYTMCVRCCGTGMWWDWINPVVCHKCKGRGYVPVIIVFKPKIYFAPAGNTLPPITAVGYPDEWKKLGWKNLTS